MGATMAMNTLRRMNRGMVTGIGMDIVTATMTSLRGDSYCRRCCLRAIKESGLPLNPERLDSIASRALTLPIGFCDPCRGFPARSIREQVI